MYYNYNIITIEDNGVQVYASFSASIGYEEQQTINTATGQQVRTVWIVVEQLTNQTNVFDKCPVQINEIESSIQNILSIQTGLQWIGSV